jgi:hypothetical protein
MRWVRKEANGTVIGNGLGLWQSMYICVLNMHFLCKKSNFCFPLATAKLIDGYFYNKQCKGNVVLSIITATI